MKELDSPFEFDGKFLLVYPRVYMWELSIPILGGGNSNIFYFYPEPWGDDPIWRNHQPVYWLQIFKSWIESLFVTHPRHPKPHENSIAFTHIIRGYPSWERVQITSHNYLWVDDMFSPSLAGIQTVTDYIRPYEGKPMVKKAFIQPYFWGGGGVR